jgi:hypothetical protein
MVGWPTAFGPVAGEDMMRGALGRANVLTSWWLGSKENEKRLGSQYSLQEHVPPSKDLASFH